MDTTIADFSRPGEQEQWEIINDPVMGGASSSHMFTTPAGTLIFEGEVSLENYGGFASIRTLPREFNLSGYKGLSTKVKGDGKDYRFRLRTDDSHEGMAYQVRFSSEKDSWNIVRLPFDTFIPVFRGQVIEGAPPLNTDHIRRIGFMIADGQAGPFRLEIGWVKIYF